MKIAKEKPAHEIAFIKRLNEKIPAITKQYGKFFVSEDTPNFPTAFPYRNKQQLSRGRGTKMVRSRTMLYGPKSLHFRNVFIGPRGKLTCVFYEELWVGDYDKEKWDLSSPEDIKLPAWEIPIDKAIEFIPEFALAVTDLLDSDYAEVIKNARKFLDKEARSDAETAVQLTSNKRGYEHYGSWS